MKNTSRVRRNGGKNVHGHQSKTGAERPDEISLVLFSQNQGASIAAIDLTGKEFERLQQVADHNKSSLNAMLIEAFKFMASRGEAAVPLPVGCINDQTCLALVDRATGKPFKKIPMSAKAFTSLILRANRAGIMPAPFIAQMLQTAQPAVTVTAPPKEWVKKMCDRVKALSADDLSWLADFFQVQACYVQSVIRAKGGAA